MYRWWWWWEEAILFLMRVEWSGEEKEEGVRDKNEGAKENEGQGTVSGGRQSLRGSRVDNNFDVVW